MNIRKLTPRRDRDVAVRRVWPLDLLANDMTRDMTRLFDMPFPFAAGGGWPDLLGATKAGFSPPMDLTDTDTSLLVSVELPGMTADDIELTLSAGTLTIKGEKSRETGTEEPGDYRTERYFGSFRRSITLPVEVNTEEVTARFDNGVLSITMAKAQAKDETRRIDIKAA